MDKKNSLDVLDCEGTFFDIGYQYGSACRDSIHRSVDLLEIMLRYSPMPIGRQKIIAAARKFLKPVEAFDAEGLDFVRGQAQGAGICFEEAFALWCLLEIMINHQNVAAMCTSFAVTGKATDSGRPLIGQNVDWHRDSPLDLLRMTLPGGTRMLSIFLCGAPYYHLSSAGLANCVNMTVNMKQPETAHIPISFYLSKALRQATIQAAEQMITETARGYAYCHIADAGGNVVGIESVDKEHVRRTPTGDVLVHANHYETEAFKEGDLYAHIVPCSVARSARMRTLILDRHGALTVDHVKKILRDHQGHPDSICRHAATGHPGAMPSESVASFIMLPDRGRLLLTHGTPCDHAYKAYCLDNHD